MNFQLLTDSYKVSHWRQLRPNTTKIYSYLEARGGSHEYKETLFHGLLPKLHMLRMGLSLSDLDEAHDFWAKHFGDETIYNLKGWQELMVMGYLPLRIRAVPEGTVVPIGNVLMTVENTDPRFAWLTNWVETLLVQTWYPITVGTISHYVKKEIAQFMDLTVGNRDGIDFMLHDFGFRGVSSVESAAIGGAAHLANFMGTDTPPAIKHLQKYYQVKDFPGYSVPAAEHSTITSWGKTREAEAYHNMLTQFPKGIVAVVSDSYDIYNACKNIWGDTLKTAVLKRDGTVVIRPDSGYPPEVVVRVLDALGKAFGYTNTEKGYRLLNPKVRVIQGDGMGFKMLRLVLLKMQQYKWATSNVAFGMGAGLLQRLDRDTLSIALKCSETECDGQVIPISKNPITDTAKRSKSGRLALIKQNGTLVTVQGPHSDDILEDQFLDGKVLVNPTHAEVRERAKI